MAQRATSMGSGAGIGAAVPAPAALTREQQAALEEGATRMRAIKRASGAASVNGWTMLVFGGLAGAWFAGSVALKSPDVWSAIVGATLVWCGWNELEGGKMLGRLEPGARKRLVVNQAVAGGVLCAYFAYQAWAAATAKPDAEMASLEQASGMNLSGMMSNIGLLMYALLGITTAIMAALMALYYSSRGAMLQRLVSQTPAWVVEMLRRQAM